MCIILCQVVEANNIRLSIGLLHCHSVKCVIATPELLF